MKDEFTCGGSVGFFEATGFWTSGDQEVHAFLYVSGESLGSLTPNFCGDPIGELAVTGAAVARDIDIEHWGFSAINRNGTTDGHR